MKFFGKQYFIGLAAVLLFLFIAFVAYMVPGVMPPCRTDRMMMGVCGVTLQEYAQRAAQNSSFCPLGENVIRYPECGAGRAPDWILYPDWNLVIVCTLIIYNLAYAVWFYSKRTGKE